MDGVFRINDSLANKISYYHLLLLLISLPFDLFYSHLILISFAVHTLIHLKKEKFAEIFTWRTLILASVFFVDLIGISYSPYKKEGFTDLGRQAVILVIPVLFCLTNLDLNKYRDKLLLGFSLCCTLTVAFLYVDAFWAIRYYHLSLAALVSPAFTNHNFSAPIGMHATFFSLQVGIALVYLITQLIKTATVWRDSAVYGVCCVVLSAGIIQLSSKATCGAVLIAIGLAVPLFVLSGGKRALFLMSGAFVTCIVAGLLYRSATFRERYFTDLRMDLSKNDAHEVTDPRLVRWGVAVKVIERSPIIGHGSGAEIPLLRETYFDHKLYSSYLNSLNCHNEYLSHLLKWGIIGFAAYLATLVYGFKRAISLRDALFLSFMLLIAVVSISENILDVDKGTMFYGFFFSFFIIPNKGVADKRR